MKSIKYLTAIALTGLLAVTAFADEKKDQKQNPIKQTIEQTIEQKYWETEKLIDQSSSCDIFNITLEGELSCMVCGPDNGLDYFCPPEGSWHSYYLCDITDVSAFNESVTVKIIKNRDYHTPNKEDYSYVFPTKDLAVEAASKLEILAKVYSAKNCK